jgi:hypothetical protein
VLHEDQRYRRVVLQPEQRQRLRDIGSHLYKDYRKHSQRERMENRVLLLRERLIEGYLAKVLLHTSPESEDALRAHVIQAVSEELTLGFADVGALLEFLDQQSSGTKVRVRVSPPTGSPKVKALEMLVYVLQEMRVIVEEYEPMQAFL